MHAALTDPRRHTLGDETIAALAGRAVPRYTSYPTAPHFTPAVDAARYETWLAALPETASVSLYLHVPFCDTLCWFCGCHTKITQQYAPIAAYLETVRGEIDLLAALLPRGHRVTHLHWGGGSPTILTASEMARMVEHMRRRLNVPDDAEFAVEVDPRGMDEARIAALAASGLTRVSLGVQDFDPCVQRAINRVQSVEETRGVIEGFRDHGVASLNIDAIYGLPGQGEAQLARTLEAVIGLKPDRLALFGYAHVPWMKRHQTMIDAAALPGPVARYRHAEAAAAALVGEGYRRIGVDHFARPTDGLARAAEQGRVQRNFQGYTVDPADALLGLGASAIGRLPHGYVQNDPAIPAYRRAVEGGRLPTVRGVAFSPEDVVRGDAIERLMCDLRFSARGMRDRHGPAAEATIEIARDIVSEDAFGLVEPDADGFAVTERGRPFVRTIAAAFDAYLPRGVATHSSAV